MKRQSQRGDGDFDVVFVRHVFDFEILGALPLQGAQN